MIVGEKAEPNALKVHDPDHAVANDERYRYFGKNVGLGCDVSRIACYVGHSDNLTRVRGSSSNALAKIYVLRGCFFVITLAKAASELPVRLVYQIDTERVE